MAPAACSSDFSSCGGPTLTAPPIPCVDSLDRRLSEGAKMKDLLLAVRADEACHSHVNHTLR